jgi:hypothetical protein
MFVLSVLDDGGERNFMTTSVSVEDGRIFAVVGDATRRFTIEDVIDLVLVAHTNRPQRRDGARTGESAELAPGPWESYPSLTMIASAAVAS